MSFVKRTHRRHMVDDDFDEFESISAGGRVAAGLEVAIALIALAGTGLFVLALYSITAILAHLPTSCEAREAREGSPWGSVIGYRIDDVRRTMSFRIVERRVPDGAESESGTVLRVSRCDVPDGADFVVYVAE
ncbi:MAG: hypothetical protein AB1673_07560 [Actinomycetota bacterium]